MNDFSFYSQVCDDGDTEDFDSAMVGYDHFGDSRHTDCIGTQNVE